jgi:hypothetical protein
MKSTKQLTGKGRRLAVYWMLCPSKTTKAPHIIGVVESLVTEMESTEGVSVPTRGKHRRDLLEHLRVILCNLLNAWETDQNLYIAHHRNRNKYKMVRTFRGFQFGYEHTVKVVNFLRDKDYIEWHKGYRAQGPKGMGQLSKMKAKGKLIGLFKAPLQAMPPNVHRDYSYKETVIVKGKKIYYTVIDRHGRKRKICKRNRVKTLENPTTRRIRRNLEAINKAIECCCIELDIEQHDLKILNLYLSINPDKHKWPIDFTRTRLYRAFVDRSLKLHGRYYGGWWENLSKEVRERILINKSPTVELDLSALFPHILYSLEKINLPEKDPYCLPGYERAYQNMRPLVKRLLLIGLNAKDELSAISGLREKYRKQQELARLFGKSVPEPPIDITKENFYPIFEKAYEQLAPIQHYFFAGRGNMLVYHVSQLAEATMLYFAHKEIPCLPVYDSLVVNVRYLDECWETIRRAFYSRFGQEIPMHHIGLVSTHHH